jgi:hypothetical protein
MTNLADEILLKKWPLYGGRVIPLIGASKWLGYYVIIYGGKEEAAKLSLMLMGWDREYLNEDVISDIHFSVVYTLKTQ